MRDGTKVAIIAGPHKGRTGKFLYITEKGGDAYMRIEVGFFEIVDVMYDEMRPATRLSDLPFIGRLFR